MEQNKIYFRASAANALMTEPKTKADKEAGNLSETAKTFVQNMWLENTFGYREDVQTDDMLKGIICEQDSMALTQKVLKGEFRSRYNKREYKGYFCGTPDVVLAKEGVIEDIKTSSNLKTFFNAEITDLYHCQGQVYMYLLGLKKFRLIYCLVKTPEEIIANKKKSLYFKFNCDEENEDYVRMAMQIDHNNNLIDKLPPEKRVKVFKVDYSQEFIDKLNTKALRAIEYYNSLKL